MIVNNTKYPLVYGMRYDGCGLTTRDVGATNQDQTKLPANVI